MVFALDASLSVGEEGFARSKNFVKQVLIHYKNSSNLETVRFHSCIITMQLCLFSKRGEVGEEALETSFPTKN